MIGTVPNSDTAHAWGIVGWPRDEALHFLRQARTEIAEHGGTAALHRLIVRLAD